MRLRPTVHLLLLDPAHRLFLFQYEDAVVLDPTMPDLRVYWVTPGGGGEPGEDFAQAGMRELWEETGIGLPTLGPCVWQRSRVLSFADGPMQCDERYYLAHVADPTISLANLLAHERITYRAHDDRIYRLRGVHDRFAARRSSSSGPVSGRGTNTTESTSNAP